MSMTDDVKDEPKPALGTGDFNWGHAARITRVIGGLLMLGALAVLLFDTMAFIGDISEPRFGEPASAVQITQVYAERIYYAVTIIGGGILLYIASRFEL